jgi:hypothetical protein
MVVNNTTEVGQVHVLFEKISFMTVLVLVPIIFFAFHVGFVDNIDYAIPAEFHCLNVVICPFKWNVKGSCVRRPFFLVEEAKKPAPIKLTFMNMSDILEDELAIANLSMKDIARKAAKYSKLSAINW